MTVYTGDLLITKLNDAEKDGNYDILFVNGQPVMSDGFDTCIYYAVYGDKNTWQNGIAQNEEEKIISDFPQVIERATISDKTKNDGIQALKKALEFLKKIKAVQDIIVSGQILSVYAIQWNIELIKFDGSTKSYQLLYNPQSKWDANWKSYERSM